MKQIMQFIQGTKTHH